MPTRVYILGILGTTLGAAGVLLFVTACLLANQELNLFPLSYGLYNFAVAGMSVPNWLMVGILGIMGILLLVAGWRVAFR